MHSRRRPKEPFRPGNRSPPPIRLFCRRRKASGDLTLPCRVFPDHLITSHHSARRAALHHSPPLGGHRAAARPLRCGQLARTNRHPLTGTRTASLSGPTRVTEHTSTAAAGQIRGGEVASRASAKRRRACDSCGQTRTTSTSREPAATTKRAFEECRVV